MSVDAESTTLSLEVAGRQYALLQRPRSLDHAFAVWDAGIGFVRYVERQRRVLASLHGRRVLEVGAGCALVSMVCAAAGACVLATDLPHAVGHMAGCVAANGFRSKGGGGGGGSEAGAAGSLDVAALAWGDVDGVDTLLREHGGAFDVIVGTDVVYQDRLVRSLLRSVALLALAARRERDGGEVAGSGRGAGGEDGGEESDGGEGGGGGGKGGAPQRRTTVYLANEARDEGTSALFAELFSRLFHSKLLPAKLYGAESAGTSLRIYEGKLRPSMTRETILEVTREA